MNAEKLLELVLDARTESEDNQRIKYKLNTIVEALEAQIRAESARAAGSGKAQAVLAKTIKNVENTQKQLKGAWDADGYQCVCDGYIAYRLKSPLPIQYIDPSITPIDLKRIADEAQTNIIYGKKLELPDIATLKSYITIKRAEHNIRSGKKKTFSLTWDFGEGKPLVNAQYLIDMLTVFPDARAYMGKGIYKPLWFESDSGDGVLMPVRNAQTTNTDVAESA